jgi:hypothetical protein
MSLSFQKLEPICVFDPRVMLNKHRTFPVLKCGSQTTFKSFTTTSVSTSSIQFSCPPPSGGIIVDRMAFVYFPVRLSFQGIPAVGNALLNASNDAPRAFPIAGSIDTLSATINNQSMNINSADIIHALMRYNIDNDLKSRAYSMTPSYQDQTQSYNDIPIGVRNPLSLYQDQPDGVNNARGAFPYTIVSNPIQTIGGTTLTSVVDVAFCEPLFLSPFYAGKTNDTGFINVTTMDFNFNFVSQLANRMWSHNDTGTTGVPFTSATAVFGGLANGPTTQFPGGLQCQMLFQYITPQETMIIPRNMPVTYPYFDTIRFPTDLALANAGTSSTYNSNNIQLNSVPLKVYIYIRERNSDLFGSASHTDTFFRINSVNVQFLNNSGLLASATFNAIYDLSRKNGCQMSYTQFGQTVNNSNFTSTYGTIGSVVCLDFAKDIGLPSLMSPGILAQAMIQIQVNATNIASRNINPTLYIVPVSAGTFTIEGVGQSGLQIGVITPTDVLDCDKNGAINYNDVFDHAFTGGDFWSGLKDFGAKLLPYLQKAHDFIKDNKLVSKVLNVIPQTQQFGRIAESVGYGEGGVSAGGASLSRKNLHNRLSKY